ncbi:MAG TPA: hypothetical protein VI894_02725 [Candidatus Nanoarchaeia archaeon]|nr:hypothetical protein [Candidatus Nanoarchaeia archaeon]
MAEEKHMKKIEELFKKSPVVSYSSIERIIRNKKKKSQYGKQLIRNLILKGRINRLAKGFYTSSNDSSLSVFCFKPAYLGLQDALSFHNLWEQETIPVILTTRKIRQGIRKVMEGNVLIRRIEKKYFFGFDYVQQGNCYPPYSDLEKTLIDMVYFREKINPEALRHFTKKINQKKLSGYLKKYPKRIRNAVVKHLTFH